VYVSTKNRTLRSRADSDSTTVVEIAVRDEGPGIAPQVMKNLFVPFVTTKDRGTGLGLAISQRVVAEMGGRIDVASSEGLGSTFTVVLPAATDSAADPVVDSSGGLLSALGPTGGPTPEPAARPASERPATERPG
jgi:signal transduction histidine kinase